MSRTDWERVIDQAAAMRVEMVQFIGGEPTLHPDLPGLIQYALPRGLEVEVFTNLVRRHASRIARQFATRSTADHGANP